MNDQLRFGEPPPGYRLPGASRVGGVRLQVGDLERSLGFYQGVLGFELRSSEGGRAVLGARGGASPLVELHERAGAAPVPPTGRLGLYHFAILLPDRASLGRFVAHLSGLGVRAGASHHLVSEALYLNDPDGLGIEVYADLPRTDWTSRGRELQMDSRPLDLQDLLRAGGGETWQRLPPGTTIGHVHLHVGDLPRASRFYHDGLGLDRMVWSYPGALFLAAGGYHHHLGVNTWAAGAPPAGEGDAKLLDWELLVPGPADVEGALGGLAEAGFTGHVDDSGGWAEDPWQTRIRLRTDPVSQGRDPLR